MYVIDSIVNTNACTRPENKPKNPSNPTGTATNLTATIGIASGGTTIGSGITMVDFTATNATVTVAAGSATPTGVATVNVQPSVSLGLAIALGG